jgi:O-methyltransferase involved in polyketide biosynthesis
MDDKERVYFDPETVSLLKEILDDAWARLQPEQRATIRKTTLAEHILKSAAQGDRERLLDAALMEFTAEGVRSTDDCN